MAGLGPGCYNTKQETQVPHYKMKPSSAFLSKASKDGFAEALNRKIFGQKNIGQTTHRKGEQGEVNEVLDWDEKEDYRLIKPDYLNGTNPGPGSYYYEKQTNSMKNLMQGSNSTFNISSKRFDDQYTTRNAYNGPGAYDSLKCNLQFKKSRTSHNKMIDKVRFIYKYFFKKN